MLKNNYQPRKLRSDNTDKVIGHNLKVIRSGKGLTQATLASKVSLTPQQIQKYESGDNRIAASVLSKIAFILDVPISNFFKDVASDFEKIPSFYNAKQEIQLIEVFKKIKNPEVRQKILDLLEIMFKP